MSLRLSVKKRSAFEKLLCGHFPFPLPTVKCVLYFYKVGRMLGKDAYSTSLCTNIFELILLSYPLTLNSTF